MVRSGDPEVDSHMAFCTRWDPLIIHERRQQFRQLTWMEYEKCVKLCEQKGIPLTGGKIKKLKLEGEYRYRDNVILIQSTVFWISESIFFTPESNH